LSKSVSVIWGPTNLAISGRSGVPLVMNTTSLLRAASLALALSVTACVAGGDDAQGDIGGDENIGRVTLALTAPPADAVCLRLTTTSTTTGLKVVKMIGLTAGMNSQQVSNLPTGTVTMLGEVFNVLCPNVVATSPMTWASDELTVTIPTDRVPRVVLILNRLAKVNVGVDFNLSALFEDIPLPGVVSRMAAAPDNSVVFTLKQVNSLHRQSNPFDYSRFANMMGLPKYVAVASDGTILTTVSPTPTATTGTLATFTAAGVAKTTFPIPFQAGDLAYDAAGTAWVGSASTAQVLRVATATTTPSGLTITLAGATSATGLLVGNDGNLRVAGAPGQLNVLKPDGTNLGAVIPLGMVPRELTMAADGTAYVEALTGQVVTVTPGGVVQPFWGAGASPVPEAAIVTTSKGVLFATSVGTLVLVDAMQGVLTYNVPESSLVGAMAVLPNGKIWVADSARPRAWILTLP
jgi:hypothetical protein